MKAEAWCMHCRELLAAGLTQELTSVERHQLVRAAVRRLLALEPDRPFPFVRGFTRAQQVAMVTAMLSDVVPDEAPMGVPPRFALDSLVAGEEPWSRPSPSAGSQRDTQGARHVSRRDHEDSSRTP